jgi:hypothetical protein
VAEYFVDSVNGLDTDDGTQRIPAGGGVGPWQSLEFAWVTATGIAAGDIITMRRNATNYRATSGTNLAILKSGTIPAPITARADFDINADWGGGAGGDVTFITANKATYTVGSKTVTFASDVSGSIAAGDWIYNATDDDPYDFSYWVDSVSTVTVTLRLPFKGTAGSNKDTNKFKPAPFYGTASAFDGTIWNADQNWFLQGFEIRGRSASAAIGLDSISGFVLKDMIIRNNKAANDRSINVSDDAGIIHAHKCHFMDSLQSIRQSGSGAASYNLIATDCLWNAASGVNSFAFFLFGGASSVRLEGCEFLLLTQQIFSFDANTPLDNHKGDIFFRNVKLGGITLFATGMPSYPNINFQSEAHDNTPFDTRQNLGIRTASTEFHITSTTSPARAGGSPRSLQIAPTTNLSSVWIYSRIKLFDIAFYATTSSKTYTIYCRPKAQDTTTGFGDTESPTNKELWIELSYWAVGGANFRHLKRSAQVLTFNQTAGNETWQALTVTAAPGQVGLAYLRGWYCKTKESARDNIFYVDPLPVVS